MRRGFREIREIKSPEKISDERGKENGSENFRKIKPESGITVEEAKSFIEDLFASMKEKEESN